MTRKMVMLRVASLGSSAKLRRKAPACSSVSILHSRRVRACTQQSVSASSLKRSESTTDTVQCKV